MTNEEERILECIYLNPASTPYVEDGIKEMDVVSSFTIAQIFDFIKSHKDQLREVAANNIPQFSKLNDVFSVLRIVSDSPEEKLDREKLGCYFCPLDAKSGAKVKYGENHYKLAVQLGLARDQSQLCLTDLGIAVHLLPTEGEKLSITSKLALRIPIIQQALLRGETKRFNIYQYMGIYLSESTVVRRRSNLRTLLTLIDKNTDDEQLHNAILNLVWSNEKE